MPLAKVFVAGLDGATDESALYGLFSRFVDVYSAKITRHQGGPRKGESMGFGFVQLAKDDLAAALELNGFLWHDRQLRVEPARR